MDPVKQAIHEAESMTFPPVPDDVVWCDLRGIKVPVQECMDNCAAPEHRPVCWLGRTYRDEPLEGASGG